MLGVKNIVIGKQIYLKCYKNVIIKFMFIIFEIRNQKMLVLIVGIGLRRNEKKKILNK